ncbi:sensor histidine kinase [Amphibiibacter pelophylacis]|uniref:ATP-binding protein n=1 Tax=Amphibiibacter pelophylacis TaxID=1799477 RepID=A0ACC6NY02_9BURK
MVWRAWLRRREAARANLSLAETLLEWMLLPLFLLWLCSMALVWLVSQHITNQYFDGQLRAQTAHIGEQLVRWGWYSPQAQAALDNPGYWWDVHAQDGRLLAASDASTRDFLAQLSLRPSPAGQVVLDTLPSAKGERRVARLWLRGVPGLNHPVLLRSALLTRDQYTLTQDILRGVILPQAALFPLALLLVWLALTRAIAPLHHVQQQIFQRDSHDLSPMDESRAPEEVVPLVQSINGLLQQLSRSLASQKHFLADAAHQLKTPLAGLRMQAELAQQQIDDGATAQALRPSLQHIAYSSQKAANMVNQLLALAHAEDKAQTVEKHPLDLLALVTGVTQDSVPRAMARRIDLGLETDIDPDCAAVLPQPEAAPDSGLPPDVTDDELAEIDGGVAQALILPGHALLLGELVRNLVDNAINYTPQGGVVTVRVQARVGCAEVIVEDSGPGVPEADRERIFEPFYRSLEVSAEGSGLGLAIAREIAAMHDATLTLAPDGENPLGGARFVLGFSLPDQAPGAAALFRPAPQR